MRKIFPFSIWTINRKKNNERNIYVILSCIMYFVELITITV